MSQQSSLGRSAERAPQQANIFKSSSFAASGVPEVVRDAQRFLRNLDAHADLHERALYAARLLSGTKEMLSEQNSALLNLFLTVAARAKMNPSSFAMPRMVTAEIANRIQVDFGREEIRYRPAISSLLSPTESLAAFRKDLTEKIEYHLEAVSSNTRLGASAWAAIADTACMVTNFFERVAVVNELAKREPLRRSYAVVVQAAGEGRVPVAHCLFTRDSVISSTTQVKSAREILKQCVGMPPEVAAAMHTVAAQEKPFSAAQLSEVERVAFQQGMRSGMQALCTPEYPRSFELNAALQLDQLLRGGEFLLSKEEAAAPWRLGLAGSVSLTWFEGTLLERARGELKQRLKGGVVLSADVTHFRLPQIPLLCALADPVVLRLHSDLPQGGDPAAAHPLDPLYLFQREPFALPMLALLGSTEAVLAHERASACAPTAERGGFSYHGVEARREAQLELRPGANVQQRVRALVGRNISGVPFILEGVEPEKPRAFGVFFQRLGLDIPGYERIVVADVKPTRVAPDVEDASVSREMKEGSASNATKVSGSGNPLALECVLMTMFVTTDHKLREHKDRTPLAPSPTRSAAAASAAPSSRAPAPAAASTPVAGAASSAPVFSEELAVKAGEVLVCAKGWGVEQRSEVAELVTLMRQISARREVKAHTLKKLISKTEYSARREIGGIRAVCEAALPVLEAAQGELKKAHSGASSTPTP